MLDAGTHSIDAAAIHRFIMFVIWQAERQTPDSFDRLLFTGSGRQ